MGIRRLAGGAAVAVLAVSTMTSTGPAPAAAADDAPLVRERPITVDVDQLLHELIDVPAGPLPPGQGCWGVDNFGHTFDLFDGATVHYEGSEEQDALYCPDSGEARWYGKTVPPDGYPIRAEIWFQMDADGVGQQITFSELHQGPTTYSIVPADASDLTSDAYLLRGWNFPVDDPPRSGEPPVRWTDPPFPDDIAMLIGYDEGPFESILEEFVDLGAPLGPVGADGCTSVPPGWAPYTSLPISASERIESKLLQAALCQDGGGHLTRLVIKGTTSLTDTSPVIGRVLMVFGRADEQSSWTRVAMRYSAGACYTITPDDGFAGDWSAPTHYQLQGWNFSADPTVDCSLVAMPPPPTTTTSSTTSSTTTVSSSTSATASTTTGPTTTTTVVTTTTSAAVDGGSIFEPGDPEVAGAGETTTAPPAIPVPGPTTFTG